MKDYRIKITETYAYEVEVKANSQKEAIQKAKEHYENAKDGYAGVADGTTFESVRFKTTIKK